MEKGLSDCVAGGDARMIRKQSGLTTGAAHRGTLRHPAQGQALSIPDQRGVIPMQPDRFFIIHNPAAGRGSSAHTWEPARQVLETARVDCHIVRTETPGHATALAEQAVNDGWPAVIAAGGDGTVHEVANGLMRAAKGEEPTVPLGIIATGSGNDFVKLLELPGADARAAARRLLHAQPRQVDVGRVRGRASVAGPLDDSRFFTNGVGMGFDARVGIEARRVRRLRGMAIYAWALLRVLRDHRTPHMRVEVDGREVANAPLTLVTAANGGCHGGGFWICPGARPDDGLLDVCVADALGVGGVLRFVPRVMRGTHVGRPGISFYQGQRIRVTSTDAVPVHTDGEILAEAAHEVEIELLPGRLTVLV
jgi:diacylglycerol kinase (ATP)